MDLKYTEIVEAFEKLKNNPLKQKIEDSLFSCCNLTKIDKLPENREMLVQEFQNDGAIVLQLKVDLLKKIGTACGISGNKCFNSKAIQFLSKHTDYVFALISTDLDGDFYILSMEIPMPDKYADELISIVEDNGGSLRSDTSYVQENWTFFDSE